MQASIKALVPYFGCKRSQAEKIVEVLGPHRCYWEPFCGSAAVLFHKEPCKREIVNDVHGGLINLARVVRNRDLALALYDMLQRTLFCKELYQESCAACTKYPAAVPAERQGLGYLPWAYHYLVASWMGRNGLAGTANEHKTGFCIRYSSAGGDPCVRFRSVVESIPGWWQRLQSATVLSEDGIALCEKIEDREGTVIYADPPYLVKGAKYAHDFGPEQHERLASVLRRFSKTRVVLSYYAHPDLAQLYPTSDWETIDRTTIKQMATSKPVAPEVLLVNKRAA
jgi:DNA adenine methylase